VHSGIGPHQSVPPLQSDKQKQSCEQILVGVEVVVMATELLVVGTGAADMVIGDVITKCMKKF